MTSLLPIITYDFTKTVGDPMRTKGFWRFQPIVNSFVFMQQIVIEVASDLDISSNKRFVYRVFKTMTGQPLPAPPPDDPTDPAQVMPVVQVVYASHSAFRDKSTEPVIPYNGVLQYTTKFLENYPMELLGPANERIEIFLADANNTYLPTAKFDVGSVAVGRFKAASEAAS